MTTLTNAKPSFQATEVIGGRQFTINDSTMHGWVETLAIMSDRAFMNEIEQGLAEIERGERLYTFEEIFGEPPAASDDE